MGLLRDVDLVTNLKSTDPKEHYVEGIILPTNPYSKESPVQASSMELHIGDIYLPDAKEGSGGVAQPKLDHVLKTGETAVIMTLETLQFPPNVAAFGFPPSRVSFKGLLMTNPGHVDPGYHGVMRFTVINMSKDPFPLNHGDPIVKLLFFTLDQNPQASWRNRNPNDYPPVLQADVDRLSKDFVDVENRATDIARKQGLQWAAGITIAATLILGFFNLIGSGTLFGNKDIKDLKTQQQKLEDRLNVDQKLTEFDKRITDIKNQLEAIQSKKGQ